jgi:hypothetical protein
MYASARKYQVDPASVGEITKKVEEGFIPLVSGVPGFVAYYLVDAGGGTVATINIFESQAGAVESNRRASDWVGGSIASLIPAAPEITAGEVTVHKWR